MRLPGFPMNGTVHMWLLAGFIQVVSLLCVQWSDPAVVVVEVVFGHFPTSQDPDWYTVSYQNAHNLTVWLDSIGRSECSPDCRLFLQLAKEPGGSDITLNAIKNNTTLKTKTFHIAPVLLSSLRVEVTTTSTLLTCSLQNRQSLTALSLHNMHIEHTHTEYTHTEQTHSDHTHTSSYVVRGLQPGANYSITAELTTPLTHLNISLTQRLHTTMETAQCPIGWLASGRSCHSVSRRSLSWGDAQQTCIGMASGGHLVDVKTERELLLLSSHLTTHNNLLLLWTALNDRLDEGLPRWSDGSSYNLTSAMTSSSLPANQTDCFALQRNTTGRGYFLTSFFCHIPLPYICHWEIPLLPPLFNFHLVEVTERDAELHWSDLTFVNSSHPAPQLYVQYQEEEEKEEKHGEEKERRTAGRVPVSLFSRGLKVPGLYPGKVYSLSLRASHLTGAAWSLGSAQTCHTRPLPPRNITISNVTASQITVSWTAPDSQHAVRWNILVRWEGVASGQETRMIVASSARSAVIAGLEGFRKYKVRVDSVTEHGVESCGGEELTLYTAVSPPGGVVVSSRGENLTACWSAPSGESPDGYYVRLRPVSQARPMELWVNESRCVFLAIFSPGQNYEVGVASVRGENMSEEINTTYRTEPGPLQAAVPLSVGSSSVVLYVQRPVLGVCDGVRVCVCKGVCEGVCVCKGVCDWWPFPPGKHTVTVGSLTPGEEYHLSVYSTSRHRTGPAYQTHTLRTRLASPSTVREGSVTESSVEMLWDPASGHGHNYEVICLNCHHRLMVQKVCVPRAVFSGLQPGRLYHFSLRTEKESFTDSPPVTLSITTAPSPVMVSVLSRTTSSVTVGWTQARDVVKGFILSIINQTSNQQLKLSAQEPWSYRFEDLSPGSYYTVCVISSNGERRSTPASVDFNTIPGAPQEVLLVEEDVTSSVFVSWGAPAGGVEGYKLLLCLSGDKSSCREMGVHSNSLQVGGLTPGSDYDITVLSLLVSDFSQPVTTQFSARPAGVCSLSLLYVNSSCAVVRWDAAIGQFDFHRITVGNGSQAHTIEVSKERQVATVTGLRDGCMYNMSVERIRRGEAGTAASLTVTTVPGRVRGVNVVSVSAQNFSMRWEQSEGCVDQYLVSLLPNQGTVSVYRTVDRLVQADVSSLSPRTVFTVMVTAASSSNLSPPVSRIINTNKTAPTSPPTNLEGERVGSNGILLSWTMPSDSRVDGYVIRYKEVCPYPDPTFKEVTKHLDIPETLLNLFLPGSTYNIKVAAENSAGIGPYSKSLYIKTAEARRYPQITYKHTHTHTYTNRRCNPLSAPGLVTNLTAFAENHTFVVVTWLLPLRINGLITKFAVKAKHARTGQTVRILELDAEDIMTGALPHCNDAADILSRGTPSPSEVTALTASSPPVTLSAVPPAATWAVPISVGVDQLRPYTAYVFEVSAFTSDGEGQVASTMVRMPESAPEDPPHNLLVWNVTSKSFSVSWDPPTIVTGRFSYVIYLYGPTGFIYENSTWDLRFVYSGLTPYTRYRVAVRAKSAGQLGPEAFTAVLTPAEAPSAVQALQAVAVDSVSVRVSWRSPAQPNGLITQYRLLVLSDNTLLQDITLTGTQDLNYTDLLGDGTFAAVIPDHSLRRKRSADSLTTSPPAFTVTLPDHTLITGMTRTAISFTHSAPTSPNTNFEHNSNTDPTVTEGSSLASMAPGAGQTSDFPDSTPLTSDHVTSETSSLSLTTSPPATPLPWLTAHPQPSQLTSGKPHLSTRSAPAATGHLQTLLTYLFTRAAASSTPGRVYVRDKVIDIQAKELSYLVSGLSPFTDYTFTVTSATTIGEGPATRVTEKTGEQVPSSVVGVSYQNVSSTSILVSWTLPLNPNGRITHYTLYGLNLHSNRALHRITHNTSILLTGLEKYTGYKLRVAASTAVGESSLSDLDDIFAVTPEDEPDTPPVGLTVVDTSPSTTTLSWSPPERANGVIQQYEVLYENQSYVAVLNSSIPRVTLTGLRPFSYYNVSVRAYTRIGHGNHTSDTLTMLSGEDVPGSPSYGLSYVSVSSNEVNVTWEHPLVPNGVITHYSLELRNSSHFLNLTTPINHAQITHLRKFAQYTLVVKAHTRIGSGNHSSDPLNITTLEDVPSDPVHNLSAQIFSSTAIIVSWDPPMEPNGRPFYLLTLQEAGLPLTTEPLNPPKPNSNPPGPPAVNNTITKITNDNVFLFTKLRKYYPYVFTVTPATSAGPAHNHTSLLHVRTDDDIPSSAPVLVSSRNLSSSSVSVVWQRPLETNGEITDYSLTLFGPGGSNTTHTPNTTLTLTLLLPYTAYNLSITAATRKGSGPPLLLMLHTDEAGPMSPPRNLSLYNHTAFSVWLTWEPSLEPNGVVTHYGFRILENNTNTLTYQNSTGPWTEGQLSGIRPHSSYEISVFSYTRVGHGDQYSTPVSFTTNESVSEVVGNLSCSGLGWDSVFLHWEPPVNPNGLILYYQVDTRSQAYIHQAYTNQYTVSGLAPDAEFTLTVTAVNSAGPGDQINCTAYTHPESVPGVPRFLSVSEATATSVTLQWAPPLSALGMLTEYRITVQLLSPDCQSDTPLAEATPLPEPTATLAPGCVHQDVLVSVNGSDGGEGNRSITLQSLAKYRLYRFRITALTNAGPGEHTPWKYTHTLAGNPDAPPSDLSVTMSSNSLRIQWQLPDVITGPTSYLIDVLSLDSEGLNQSVVRSPEELRIVVVSNLTAFTRYSVTVTAFTGSLENARRDGQATEPTVIRTMEEEPRDPPKNVTLQVIPEEVTRVFVTFAPPEEPNGNISSYTVLVYRQGQLEMTINHLNVVKYKNRTLTAVIDGLKGGYNYSIRIAAVNGAGLSPPSSEVRITTGIIAPAKPTQRPQAVLDRGGVAMVTSRSIIVRMPACFYSDDNGPISSIQIIVAESGVMDSRNLTNWKMAFLSRPAPYLTDNGFPNPLCVRDGESRDSHTQTSRHNNSQIRHRIVRDRVLDRRDHQEDHYVIGEEGNCLTEEYSNTLCNGPLKPNTVYVFKFRATNIRGQYTDSDYSEHIRTTVDGLLTRDEQIILGVLLSFFLAVLLIIIIYASVRIRQRQKEGGTYSPREAEIIETKFKLDQMIAVADLELKEEKLHRLLSYRKSLKPVNKKSFLQHVEDLCANENAKFQEEFAELPKLLHDLATSDADLPWNRSTNRFTNIKPYNNNRVKLLSEPGLPGSDYINASFISGYLCPSEFIATQGPLPGTVADFWRMIWETRTQTIAMLTQCYEKGRIRCHQYWPEDNKPVTVFGDIIITKLTEDVYPDWTVRALKVERHGDYMVVHHFNYTSWPEHGVPESSTTLIQFVRAIRANRHENTTIVVHCSAGVGRTGVFIALDHLIQHVSDHDFVDIYGLVAELRSERMCMVQNLAQYMFLHQSTLDLLNSKGNSQSIWFVNYSALEKMDSLDAMEGDVELEWEETTM
ncbi:phosphatidylinositol phosphatase PTPRQ isoform X2 [Oncorhynchus keta]|uniref:phosphatidylinositol phosphatase PTPRQ isoform X2 n=1 Tax=Oncorhynchus keta TaxID=8018 RepID=UPI00227ADF1A|nr:phosphatidylinositol phosphatase PTPRQ isoform X2 [Oncorhynchus keta]